MALNTNYKDDVFSGQRKYSQTTNGDGTVSFTDETQYSQVGDTFGAAQVNEQNTHINNLDDKAFMSDNSAMTDIADGDYFPIYDTSASARKKTLWSNIKSVLTNVFAIKNHASAQTTYGTGNASLFGHVKLSVKYTSSDGAASASVGASSKAVYDSYTANKNSINSTNQTVSALQSSLSTTNTNLSSAVSRISTNETEISNLKTRATRDEGYITTNSNNITSLTGRMNTAEGNITSQGNSISSLNTRMGTAESNISSLQSSVNSLKRIAWYDKRNELLATVSTNEYGFTPYCVYYRFGNIICINFNIKFKVNVGTFSGIKVSYDNVFPASYSGEEVVGVAKIDNSTGSCLAKIIDGALYIETRETALSGDGANGSQIIGTIMYPSNT